MRRISGLTGLPIQEFQRQLAKARSIAIVAHTDLDGLAASRSLIKSSFGPRVQLVLTTDSPLRDITPEQERELIAAAPELVLFLDIAPVNYAQMNRILAERRGILVDHHKHKDFSKVPNLKTGFSAHALVSSEPDHYSTSFLFSELLGEPYEAEFVISALLADENFDHFRSHFECTEDERLLAYHVGQLYKQVGSIQSLDTDGTALSARIRTTMEQLAIDCNDLRELHAAIHSDEAISQFLEKEAGDSARIAREAVLAVREAGNQETLLIEFQPTTGFFTAGFIYSLQKLVREECPEFNGVLIVAQKGAAFTRLDGLSTNPARSAGEIFAKTGVGGGHHHVGGGRLESGDTFLKTWFDSITNCPGIQTSDRT